MENQRARFCFGSQRKIFLVAFLKPELVPKLINPTKEENVREGLIKVGVLLIAATFFCLGFLLVSLLQHCV